MAVETIVVDGGALQVVLGVGEDGRLHQLSFGAPAAVEPTSTGFPTALFPLAHPTFGEEPLREPALRVTHADGATSTRLVFDGHVQESHDGGVVHRVRLVDRVAPLAVTLGYRTWPVYGLVEQWVEVTNLGDDVTSEDDPAGPINGHVATVTLHRVASSAPAFSGTDPFFTYWGGGWANEWTESTDALTLGTKTVASAGGVRPSLHLAPVVMLAPHGRASETSGTVALATTVWGGDVRIDAEVAPQRQLRLFAGAQHRGAERHLGAGETYVTPSVLWAWSDEGIGPASRALHRFAREEIVRDGHRRRATVVNTWEAVGFSLDPDGLAAQIDAAAEVGAELFLLDDGWFGTAYPRDDDTTALGDWEIDRAKLPDGLQPLIDHTRDRGLRFGLWVEPEMVNPHSALYEQHPEWVIAEPARDRREERQQLVLDLCQPEVAAFCVDVIDRILSEHSGIDYLKWDANRDLTEPGSRALAADRQSHLPIDRVHATFAVMAEVARRHPGVELMLCASGGGRSDLGTLRYFHELWTSDNTDPVDRVRIQWGASHLLPASVLAAHVTRWGQKPFAFACAVAMSGRFGFDVDLRSLTDAERATARAATEAYGRIAGTVQHGDLHRLVSPVDSNFGAVAYRSDAAPDTGAQTVVFAYRLDDPGPDLEPDTDLEPGAAEEPSSPLLAVPGLDRGATYRVEDLMPGPDASADSITHTGAELADGALGWPVGPAPSAAIWLVSPLR